MANQIEVLKQTELLGQQFTVYGTPQEPLLLAKEVGEMIDVQSSRQMVQSVDEEERLTYTIYTSGQRRETWFLTEYGLYEVLMQSRKPIAKQFKQGVKQLLRDIRLGNARIEKPARRPRSLPRSRADYRAWYEVVSPWLGYEEVGRVAAELGVTVCHVRKVLRGTSASQSVIDALGLVAYDNHNRGYHPPRRRNREAVDYQQTLDLFGWAPIAESEVVL